MTGAIRAMGEAASHMAWGSPSVRTWREACELRTELSRSRRRRKDVSRWWRAFGAAVMVGSAAAVLLVSYLTWQAIT